VGFEPTAPFGTAECKSAALNLYGYQSWTLEGMKPSSVLIFAYLAGGAMFLFGIPRKEICAKVLTDFGAKRD
jgi:hypothetical protein